MGDNKTTNQKKSQQRRKWKHINENYDEHIENTLPLDLHRGDYCSTNRFLGYADAMMATCATFLVLPLRNLNDKPNDESLSAYLYSMRGEQTMFGIGFLIICTIWETYNVRSIVVKRLDDILVLIGQVQMLTVCVLPFSMALQGHFPEQKTAVYLITVVIVIHEILDMLFLAYAFASPAHLHFALRNLEGGERCMALAHFMVRPLLTICISVGTCLLTLADYRFAWVLFSVLILYPLARKVHAYSKRHKIDHLSSSQSEYEQVFWFYTKRNISRERIETFTDAAVAIIACVQILDITVEEFPPEENVKEYGLDYVLVHMQGLFFAFLYTYTKISFLWFINHTTLNLFRTFDIATLYLQKLFLVFLSLTPFSASMSSHYVRLYPTEGDTQVAMQYRNIIYILACGTQFLLMMWGWYRKEKLLKSWVINNHGSQQHVYLVMKTLTMPFWSFINLLGTLGSLQTALLINNIELYIGMLTFVVLKFLFANNLGRKYHQMAGGIEEEEDEEEERKDNKNSLSSRENNAFEKEDGFKREIAGGKLKPDDGLEREAVVKGNVYEKRLFEKQDSFDGEIQKELDEVNELSKNIELTEITTKM